MGKKPRRQVFSSKKKKQQLQEKREKQRTQGTHFDAEVATIKPIQPMYQMNKSGQRNEFTTVFMREDDTQIWKRKTEFAAAELDLSMRGTKPSAEAPPRDLLLNHPRQKILRTGPTCSTVADLEVLEQANFDGWVKAVYRKYERRELNHFEHNLGVWRQLWHVINLSDVLVIMTDARNPTFHLAPSLYEHVVTDLNKRFIIVLNKCDLVPQATVDAWVHWLKQQYPDNTRVVALSTTFSTMADHTSIGTRRRAWRAAKQAKPLEHMDHRVKAVTQLLRGADADDAVVEQVVHRLHHAAHGDGRLHSSDSEEEDTRAKVSKGGGKRDKGRSTGSGGAEEQKGGGRGKATGGRAAGSGKAAKTNGGGGRRHKKKGGKGGSSSYQDRYDVGRSMEDDVAAIEAAIARATGGLSLNEVGSDDGSDGSDSGRSDPEDKLTKKKGKAARSTASAEGEYADDDVSEKAESATAEYTGPTLKIGFIGQPNVGKSSLINAICGEKRASVSRTPGHTKRSGTIHVVPGLTLYDCPGLVFPALVGHVPLPEGVTHTPDAHARRAAALTASEAPAVAPRVVYPDGTWSSDEEVEGDTAVSAAAAAAEAPGSSTGRGKAASASDADSDGDDESGGASDDDSDSGDDESTSAKQDKTKCYVDWAATSTDTRTVFSEAAASHERAVQECCGVIPLAQLREPYTAVRLLAEHLPLEAMYGLKLPADEDYWTALNICEALALKRGFMVARAGRPDAHRSGREIVYDCVDGIVPMWFEPPVAAKAAGPE